MADESNTPGPSLEIEEAKAYETGRGLGRDFMLDMALRIAIRAHGLQPGLNTFGNMSVGVAEAIRQNSEYELAEFTISGFTDRVNDFLRPFLADLAEAGEIPPELADRFRNRDS